jgi:small-conductance mechanosensitive channel
MDQIAAWLERSNISLMSLLATAALIVATAWAVTILNRLLRRLMSRADRRLHLSHETVLTVTRLLTGSLWLMAALMILHVWGISVAGLWTFLLGAIAVIGVGFLAVWTMVSNVTASSSGPSGARSPSGRRSSFFVRT